MNAKVFSILVGILIVLIMALGGTYYYLFEYPKTQQTIQNEAQNLNPMPNPTPNENLGDKNETNTSNEPLPTPITPPQNNDNNKTESQSIIQKPIKKEPEKILPSAKNDTLSKSQSKETTEKLKKSEKPIQKIKEYKKEKPHNKQKTKISTIKEYQQKGKDSRLEPELSSETVKVYVMEGKALSEYRINLLKDMLEPVQSRSKDYNISVFIQMLPKHEMKISIYNKDIIFSNMKKAYKHIDVRQLAPYLSNPESLNANIKREEIIERMAFKVEENAKGSDFSRHIKGLKKGLETAQYFFPFCEIIEVSAKSKK